MATEYTVNKTDLESVAEAIRGKLGTSEKITFPNGFVDGINAIETSGGGDSEAEAIIDGFIDGSVSGEIYSGVTKMRSSAFSNCNITKITLPNVSPISSKACEQCMSLTEAIFPSAAHINASAFYGCSQLKTLIVGTNISDICTIQNTTVLSNTLIAKGEGYIYVPDDLVEDYKVATNWAKYADQIKGISELEG
jgi:hypothetical protein